MPAFTLKKTTRSSYEGVLARIPELLKADGFGVLAEIEQR